MVDESIEIFENLPSLDRNAYEALIYAAACHPEKYRQLSRYLENWSEKYASHIEQKTLVFSKHKEKKIRIGYVSPDFRRHPVAYFLVAFALKFCKNPADFCRNPADILQKLPASLADFNAESGTLSPALVACPTRLYSNEVRRSSPAGRLQ